MTVAEVRLWGSTIGAVVIDEDERIASFEYDRGFAQSGIEVSPIMMPLETPPGRSVYRFPELDNEAFRGLPGLLADSLPDRFGNALINAWLATQGRLPASFNSVERLCYIGTRGMGALEYAPAKGPRARKAQDIDIEALVALASEILSNRQQLQGSLTPDEREESLRDILRVGTSAGGARAKAVIAWNPTTNEVRSGQVDADPGFEHWLLKFDGVSGNRDKELEDPHGYCAIEYAYYLMAREAGILMNECRLLAEGPRRHFMTRRFDRVNGGGLRAAGTPEAHTEKIHVQSLAALGHFDYNRAGAYSYEQAFLIMRRLDLPMSDVEQLFRRMVFNVVARNQDDHVKNISFMMDKSGRWSLTPAYDVTYAYNPSGAWTASHQMSINGKRSDIAFDDLQSCAETALLKRGRAKAILAEVTEAVKQWPEFADAAQVDVRYRDAIGSAHLLSIR